jgi:hypothetical protein
LFSDEAFPKNSSVLTLDKCMQTHTHTYTCIHTYIGFGHA